MMDENQQLVFIEYFFLTFISENYNAKNTYIFVVFMKLGLLLLTVWSNLMNHNKINT